jgi:flagellar basal-body rod modification protein FlgD
MELTPTGAAGTTSRTPTVTPAAESAAGPDTDFQTFLTLLTAQMRNQDPLKPLESTEFVAQLASFSTVEQQVRANDRLDRILDALGGSSAAGVAQWIGREVRAPVPASFQGLPVEVATAAKPGADRAVLVVTNAADREVARIPLQPGQEVATWDGRDAMGQLQANGSYRFAVESYRNDALIGTEPGGVFAAVSEVRIEDGVPVLVLAGGERVALDAITGVR